MDNKRLDEAVEAAVDEIKKAKHTCFDRWTDHDAMRAALLASLPALLDDLDTVVQQMTDYLDQDVDPDFDVIERWRDTLTAIYAPSLGEGDGR